MILKKRREAAKKVISMLVDSPLRGGEVRGCPIRKKGFFLFLIAAVLFTTKPWGEGAKGFSGLSTRFLFFCGFPKLVKVYINVIYLDRAVK